MKIQFFVYSSNFTIHLLSTLLCPLGPHPLGEQTEKNVCRSHVATTGSGRLHVAPYLEVNTSILAIKDYQKNTIVLKKIPKQKTETKK